MYYDNALKPALIVECKASDVKISQTTFDQIARYNMPLRVNYLLVTNGIQHFCCRMEYEKEEFIDVYNELKKKLIQKGIPPDEIVFIHEADNEVKKKELLFSFISSLLVSLCRVITK